jgi:hypothetical protein
MAAIAATGIVALPTVLKMPRMDSRQIAAFGQCLLFLLSRLKPACPLTTQSRSFREP